MKVKSILKKIFSIRVLSGLVIGGVLGFLYYYYIGCERGCSITSSPVNSTIFGALAGSLLLYK